jgi:hypothetical protein
MWIDEKTVEVIQAYVDGKIKVAPLLDRFIEIGFRKGGTTPVTAMGKALASVTQAEPDPELELSPKQKIETLLEYKARGYFLDKYQTKFLMENRNNADLGEGQLKFLDKLYGVLIQELASHP